MEQYVSETFPSSNRPHFFGELGISNTGSYIFLTPKYSNGYLSFCFELCSTDEEKETRPKVPLSTVPPQKQGRRADPSVLGGRMVYCVQCTSAGGRKK